MKINLKGATLSKTYISQAPLGNGLAIRKVRVLLEEIVADDANVDLQTAKYQAIETALREVSKKLFP